jgi:hypothetical protein
MNRFKFTIKINRRGAAHPRWKNVETTRTHLIIHPGAKFQRGPYGYTLMHVYARTVFVNRKSDFHSNTDHTVYGIDLDAVQTACEQINALGTRQWLSWRVMRFLIQI